MKTNKCLVLCALTFGFSSVVSVDAAKKRYDDDSDMSDSSIGTPRRSSRRKSITVPRSPSVTGRVRSDTEADLQTVYTTQSTQNLPTIPEFEEPSSVTQSSNDNNHHPKKSVEEPPEFEQLHEEEHQQDVITIINPDQFLEDINTRADIQVSPQHKDTSSEFPLYQRPKRTSVDLTPHKSLQSNSNVAPAELPIRSSSIPQVIYFSDTLPEELERRHIPIHQLQHQSRTGSVVSSDSSQTNKVAQKSAIPSTTQSSSSTDTPETAETSYGSRATTWIGEHKLELGIAVVAVGAGCFIVYDLWIKDKKASILRKWFFSKKNALEEFDEILERVEGN